MSNVTSAVPLVSPHVRAFTNPSGAGDTQIVAAVAGARYRVLALGMVTTLANAVHFRSNTNAISATWPLGANGGIVLDFCEHGWFETAAGEALVVNLGTATATGIQLQYIVLPG
jgi:hypothetical protein